MFGVNDTPLQSVFISKENEIWSISKLGGRLDCALVKGPAAPPPRCHWLTATSVTQWPAPRPQSLAGIGPRPRLQRPPPGLPTSTTSCLKEKKIPGSAVGRCAEPAPGAPRASREVAGGPLSPGLRPRPSGVLGRPKQLHSVL